MTPQPIGNAQSVMPLLPCARRWRHQPHSGALPGPGTPVWRRRIRDEVVFYDADRLDLERSGGRFRSRQVA
jgi:hypothetical protein